MTVFHFYHLTETALQDALPALLEKTLQKDMRAVVRTASPERAEALAAHLWVHGRASFLPHGTAKDGHAAEQPIWITSGEETPNGAQILFLIDGVREADVTPYTRVCVLFWGGDAEAVQGARAYWKDMKAAGHSLRYWQQEAQGWVCAAES